MKVILLENVERVGKQADVLNVRDGYARNFLLPRKLAVEASGKQLKRLEEMRQQLSTRNAAKEKKLADRVAQLEALTLKAELRVGAEGKAFGAITNAEIVELLAVSGHVVDKHDVLLAEPIKEPGTHDVAIRVGPDARATVKIWVVAEMTGSEKPV
jgi:large subunit ribosomal protein L9